MRALGWIVGIAAIYTVALAVDLTRYTPEDAIASAAGTVIAAAIFPWLYWLYIRHRRHPQQPPSFAKYFFVGTSAMLFLIYLSQLIG